MNVAVPIKKRRSDFLQIKEKKKQGNFQSSQDFQVMTNKIEDLKTKQYNLNYKIKLNSDFSKCFCYRNN